MENKNQSNNVITKLNTENGIVSSEGDVLKEMCSFYEQLYTSKSINDVDIDYYLSDDVLNSLVTHSRMSIPDDSGVEFKISNLLAHRTSVI